jgi:ubiquinone/menaquinone biosynthesis C-methylase UbiE
MNLEEIKNHWETWADTYGTSLRATTKTSTAKALELDALTRTLREILASFQVQRVLEVGCGNGQNCFHLAETFPELSFTGVDLVPKMIESAREIQASLNIQEDRLLFLEGNILNLRLPHSQYDAIYTDRCLINLNTDELQKEALISLAGLLPVGGYLFMIENSQQTYEKQNLAREMLGLPRRTPASFNHFLNEELILPHLSAIGLELEKIEDFISFHDLVLYVLVPAINGGVVDYEHPLVKAATRLNMGISSQFPSGLGAWGQNRLFLCRKVQPPRPTEPSARL